jgi:hypothetical protein
MDKHSNSKLMIWLTFLILVCAAQKVKAATNNLNYDDSEEILAEQAKLYIPGTVELEREGICGLWVLNQRIKKKKNAENMKKIMGAIWELPAK